MDRSQLEEVLGLILNEAEFQDIEVILEAVERRRKDLNSVGHGGLNLKNQAKTMSRAIQDQLAASQDQVADMARRFVTDLIRQKEPNIPEEHLQALLEEWLPTQEQKVHRAQTRPAPQSAVPPDMLFSMVRDFVDYSVGGMSGSKQIVMREQLGADWVDTFWAQFPNRIQKLIHVFLKGKLSVELFWQEIRATLDGNRQE